MNLLDLPTDIFHLIFPHLDAADFLSLTATCRALHQPELLNDSQFWAHIVRGTFRVPNAPSAYDGKRWQKLYRRLLTQSRIYTWGSNEKACLGHSYYDGHQPLIRAGHGRIVNPRRQRQRVSWPGEMQGTKGLGVISDVQCGGWSTNMLTSKGAIYTVGVLDGLQFNQRRPPYMQAPLQQPTPLKYPPGFAQPHERTDVSTAIKQFSAGRAHVLGVSDSGRIWSWQNAEHAAIHVKFVHYDTRDDGATSGTGTVHKVVAGWSKSSALVEGTGIVLWDPIKRGHDETEIEDAALVLESAFVPKTSFRQRTPNRQNDATESLADSVGEVTNYIVLEEVIVFVTHLGKVFVAQVIWNENDQRVSNPTEVPVPASANGEDIFATDVQGSFRTFAVFLRSGAVLTSTQDRLMDILNDRPSAQDSLFKRIPALQNTGVISVAFGDYHFHALHSTGQITSYGVEPQACGALGLCGHGDPEGRLRGMRYAGMGGDGRLLPHAYSKGRQVWFENEKRDWISFITAGGYEPQEAVERMRMALGSPDTVCQGEVSEWIEQQGRDWEEKYEVHASDEDGLGAYFALSVTAAGWHSGALVLVNEDLAKKVAEACEVRDPALPPEEDDHKERDDVVEERNSSLLSPAVSTLVSTLVDYGRWFLGVPPYNNPAPPQPRYATTGAQPGHPNTAPIQRPEQIHVPRNYGDSPREGYKYKWAFDHFPRLRLSNGTEMPGEVEFDEWRYERPDFDLNAGP